MRDIRSVKDYFHGLLWTDSKSFCFTCPIHDVSHLKFNRCLGVLRRKIVASSAYFMRKFKISSGLRSWANIIKRAGPIPEPWMIDRFIGSVQERWNWAWWPDYDQYIRNDIHWIMKTGVSRQNSLRANITLSTVSKALLKSISTHLAYWLDSSKVCIAYGKSGQLVHMW